MRKRGRGNSSDLTRHINSLAGEGAVVGWVPAIERKKGAGERVGWGKRGIVWGSRI